ncbi:hypothetical protein ACSVC9_14105 [Clostridium sp. LBM24168]
MNRRNVFLYVIIILLICGTLTGCKSSAQNNSNLEETFDMKAASNVVETYMNYMIKGQTENAKKLYSKDLFKSPAKKDDKDLKIFGYNLADSNQVGRSGIFTLNVSRTHTNKPFASLDQYSMKVTKEGQEYKISEIKTIVQEEVFIYKNKIRMKSKEKANTNLVISFKSFPGYVFSKDDKASINKLSVPKSNVDIMNLSYEGDMLAVTTYNGNCYIGVINIDQSLAVQAGESGQDQGQNSTDNENMEDSNESNGIVEVPIGQEIITLDLLKDSKVNFVEFSKDEKFLAVQYSSAQVGNCIRMYRVDGGDMIDYKFEEKFPLDKVNVVFSSFDEDIVNFDVVAKKNQDPSLSNIIGKWQLDLKSFEAVRM